MHFDEEKAERSVRFFPKYLCHVKGSMANKPLELEPWQAEVNRHVFGRLQYEGGPRVVRTVYETVARKNSKSTRGAGIGLYLLTCDDEEGAEIYSVAGDREQAGIIFEMAKQMIARNKTLSKMLRVYRTAIVFEAKGSSYKAISAEAYSKHGSNPHGILFDELHTQPNRELWDVMRTGTGARTQPITWAFTTAGFDRHSICYEQYDYGCKVRDGLIDDPSFLPVIYEAPKEADWKDPKVWRLANPMMDIIPTLRPYLEQEAKRAEAIPAYENTFRRLHLNQWTEQETRWLSVDKWDACACELPDLTGEPCYVGFDLSSRKDLTAMVCAFPQGDTVYLKTWAFTPEETITEREKEDRVPYGQWVRDGDLIATPGAAVDYEYLWKVFATEVAPVYEVLLCAVDPWNAQWLLNRLSEEYVPCFEHRQGFASLSEPSKTFENLLIEGRLKHDGNAVLRRAAEVVAIESDPAGNIKPSKKASKERIDPIVASVMAVGRAIMHDDSPSVWCAST